MLLVSLRLPLLAGVWSSGSFGPTDGPNLSTRKTDRPVSAIGTPRPDRAFRLLCRLVVQDTQIAALRAANPPTDEQIRTQAECGIDHFFRLMWNGLSSGR